MTGSEGFPHMLGCSAVQHSGDAVKRLFRHRHNPLHNT